MTVTVQWIRTTWTKRSRGGDAAARRNAAPVGFPLPELLPGSAHIVAMHERDGFAPHDAVYEVGTVNLSLRESAGALRVFAHVDDLYGIPPRRSRPPAVRLRRGEWLRWQLNYRFSSAAGRGEWMYWLDTFNVAYGEVAEDVFLSPPHVSVDERGPLR